MRSWLTDPVLAPGVLLRRPVLKLPAPLDRPGTQFFGFARMALFAGLKLLGIKPGDNVLLPSYICNVVIAPFAELSIEVRFYAVDENLQPVFESASAIVDHRTRALLAVNYFGFPQNFDPIRDFCSRHGLYLIEDNTHGFLSCNGATPLGTFGDIGLVAFRKTVGIPDGAALFINDQNLIGSEPPIGESEPPRNPLFFFVSNLLANIEAQTGLGLAAPVSRMYQTLRNPGFNGSARGRPQFDEETSLGGYQRRWSRLSSIILHRIRPEEISEIRRGVFTAWLRWFQRMRRADLRPVFDRLDPGVVPFAFPVAGAGCDRLRLELRGHGVRANTWPPNLPRNSSGWGANGKALLLPVHANLPQSIQSG
jgi:DegT/DnrJ/EryC1/StrS aminotransferase family